MLSSGSIQAFSAAVGSYAEINIADYQRNYSWEEEQVRSLVNDVKIAAGTGDTHFLGTLILHETSSDVSSIVDGQQRITTLFILVARLRDELKKLSTTQMLPRTPRDRTRDVLTDAEDLLYNSKTSKEARFSSNLLLREMFLRSIISDDPARPIVPARDSKLRAISLPLRRAYWVIENLIQTDLASRPDEPSKLSYIDGLIGAITTNLQVLKITTGSLQESLDLPFRTSGKQYLAI